MFSARIRQRPDGVYEIVSQVRRPMRKLGIVLATTMVAGALAFAFGARTAVYHLIGALTPIIAASLLDVFLDRHARAHRVGEARVLPLAAEPEPRPALVLVTGGLRERVDAAQVRRGIGA